MNTQARVKAIKAEAWFPKVSVITPRMGGIIPPPHTPTIKRDETSFVFSGTLNIDVENTIEKRLA